MKKREEEIKLEGKKELDKKYKEIERKIVLQYELRFVEEIRKYVKMLYEFEDCIVRK